MNHQGCAPPSAELSPPGNGNTEAVSNVPHTARAAGRILDETDAKMPNRKTSRVMTIRIEPSDEHWKLCRTRGSEAAAYRNKAMQAKLADALGWRVPEGSTKDKLSKHIRLNERGDLSANVYVACEAEVKKDWMRSGRAIMAGASMPQYSQKDSLGIATISGTPGIKIVNTGHDRFAVHLHITAQQAGDGWIAVPVTARTVRDEYRWPKLLEMANGDLPILMARVIMKRHSGKTLLQITYPVERRLPVMGERVATLSQLSDGRILLRTEAHTIDYTSRLHALATLKDHWDGVRRRWGRSAGRRKGSARRTSEHLDTFGFSRKCSTELHQWSIQMVNWAVSEGVGTFVIAGVVGGDWAAAELKEKIKYKCEERGIKFGDASLEQAPTDRAIKQAVTKKRQKAQKMSDAVREIEHQLSGG